jgi:putative ABC transport system permease protein
VLQSGGTTFDSEIWAKRSLIGPMFGKSTYTTLVCRTADGAAADTLAKFFREQYTKATLNAVTETKYFEGLNSYNQVLLSAIMFVTVILAVGGVFGVMNTMFAAISQRTKDIGVLRLMGYGRRHIVASFLLEALVIGLIGGVIGCALGALWNGVSVTSILASSGGGGKTIVFKLIVDAAVLAAGILLTLVMALIGGLLPALNAMRLTALEALR